MYSNEYFAAWTCVPFLLVGTVFNGIAQLEGSLFAAAKKTKEENYNGKEVLYCKIK